MNTLKQLIKDAAAKQPAFKNQRKTVTLEGERTLSPDTAAWEHRRNRASLREMYMIYGILRGKLPEEIESNPKEPLNMELINKEVEKYKEEWLRDGI